MEPESTEVERARIKEPKVQPHGLDALVDRTQADELIVVSDVFDFERRRRSLERIAEAAREIRTGGSRGAEVGVGQTP